jgi:hypothetical protein
LSSKLHGRLKIGGSWSRPPWAKSETLSPKAKMDKGMAQVVAHLPIKCKALNSNSSTAKRKKKKKKRVKTFSEKQKIRELVPSIPIFQEALKTALQTEGKQF